VEGLAREINNGGYDQFFRNRSRPFVPTIVDSLLRIGCVRAGEISQKATEELGLSALSAEAIATVIAVDDPDREAKLKRCDDACYKAADQNCPTALRLYQDEQNRYQNLEW